MISFYTIFVGVVMYGVIGMLFGALYIHNKSDESQYVALFIRDSVKFWPITMLTILGVSIASILSKNSEGING